MDPPLPCRVSAEAYDLLVQERLAAPLPTTQYNLDQMKMARTYLIDGAPYGINEDLLAYKHGRNHFDGVHDQALCLDALARFATEGFVTGPFALGSIEAPQIVGAFTREQESSLKKRCISDLSQPRSGGSFNDALSRKPVLDWPLRDPGTVEAAVVLILNNSQAFFCKADIKAAYKMVAVQKRQRRFQVYRFGNALFRDHCLLFG